MTVKAIQDDLTSEAALNRIVSFGSQCVFLVMGVVFLVLNGFAYALFFLPLALLAYGAVHVLSSRVRPKLN